MVLQLLDRLDAAEGHIGQQGHNLHRGVVTAQRTKARIQVGKQTVLSQGREGAKHAAEGHIAAGFKTRRGAGEESQGGRHPFRRPRAGRSQRVSRRGILHAAIRLVRCLVLTAVQCGNDRLGVRGARRLQQAPLVDCFTERIVLDAQFRGDLFARRTALQQFLGRRRRLVGHHCRTTAAPRSKEAFDSLLSELLLASQDALLGDAKVLDNLRDPASALANQLRREHPKGAAIIFAVGEYRHHPNEVRPLPIFPDDADEGIDLGGPIGDKR